MAAGVRCLPHRHVIAVASLYGVRPWQPESGSTGFTWPRAGPGPQWSPALVAGVSPAPLTYDTRPPHMTSQWSPTLAVGVSRCPPRRLDRRERASMESGFGGRSQWPHGQSGTTEGVPQWSPALAAGVSELAQENRKCEGPVRLNGVRSWRPESAWLTSTLSTTSSGPQWSPALVAGVSRAGCSSATATPSPQWSPALAAGVSRRCDPPDAEASRRASMESGPGGRSQDRPDYFNTQNFLPQWSPVLAAGVRACGSGTPSCCCATSLNGVRPLRPESGRDRTGCPGAGIASMESGPCGRSQLMQNNATSIYRAGLNGVRPLRPESGLAISGPCELGE